MAYNPSYKWINPTYPIYNWGYNPLPKWVVRHQVDTDSQKNWIQKLHSEIRNGVVCRNSNWSYSETTGRIQKPPSFQHIYIYIIYSWPYLPKIFLKSRMHREINGSSGIPCLSCRYPMFELSHIPSATSIQHRRCWAPTFVRSKNPNFHSSPNRWERLPCSFGGQKQPVPKSSQV